MHCNLQSTELQKWEEDLINFKKLSNPFHSQSRRRADEQKTLESLIAVSILSIRLDEFLLVSFFFRLSLSSVSSSSFSVELAGEYNSGIGSSLWLTHQFFPSILPTGMYLVFSVLLFFCDFKWSNTCSFALNIVVNIAVKCEYFVL